MARPEHEILGAILRERREAASLTQRQVAEQLDRSQAFVWKVEQGIQHIDIPTLIDLAQILNATATDLMGELESHKSSSE